MSTLSALKASRGRYPALASLLLEEALGRGNGSLVRTQRKR